MRRLALCAVCLTASATFAAERVPICFDAPAGLETYTGLQPVTFGVPFSRGTLNAKTDRLRVVDEQGAPLRAQFEVTATWAPSSDDVRWLLVDLLTPVEKGRPKAAFLEFGRDVAPPTLPPLLSARKEAGKVTVDTGAGQFVFDAAGGDVGVSALVAGDGKPCVNGGRQTVDLELSGPARAVVRLEGDYVSPAGQTIARYVTRARLYAGCSFVRVFHTMEWLADETVGIGRLSFQIGRPVKDGQARGGVDGKPVGPAAALRLAQADWDRVSGDAQGKRLDGWAEVRQGNESVFAALRWPWQQHPTGFEARDGRLTVGLIAPEKPMSLAWQDAAVPFVFPRRMKQNAPAVVDGKVTHWWDVYTMDGKGADGRISPRGVSRTYEMLLWFTSGAEPPPAEVRNALAQRPVAAFADPAFACRAGLPSPVSPRDPKRFPDMEAALERAFGWYTRELAWEGDFGTWNYGDLQWCWHGGYATYRYWMNNGKGWPIVPWVLWLRSGQRRYLENAEANSRHLMDVDTCHVPEWDGAADGKRRGAAYEYSAMHWSKGPQIDYFIADSEYLPYCWYMTGYERARDVLRMRAEALARFDWKRMVDYYQKNPASRSRSLYVMLKELTVLYEATWDHRLKAYLDAYLDLVLQAQDADGWFTGIVNNHYLDQGLNLALRVYGPERVLPAIEKRLRYQGDVERAGVTGRRDGPTSLWSAVTVAQLRRDPRWLNVAAGLGRSRAWVVDDGDSSWRGLNPCPGHEAGPLLRDWTVVMAALAALPAKDEPPGVAPPAWVNANLPLSAEDQKTWKARQVLLALKEKDEPIRVDCAFLCHNFGLLEPTPQKVRVFAPDGRLIAEHERDIQVCYDKQRGFETMSIEIPPDGRSAGVYVLEIWTRPLALPTVAVSSTGKLVHYLPPGLRNFSSPSYAGTVWFQPRGDEDVAFAFTGLPWGRVTVLDADGKPVASSRLTGDAESRSPAAEPCRFRPAAKDERLFCAVTASTDWHRLMDVRGIKPFVATQRQAWFDPTRQTCPPLARFAEPPQAETR